MNAYSLWGEVLARIGSRSPISGADLQTLNAPISQAHHLDIDPIIAVLACDLRAFKKDERVASLDDLEDAFPPLTKNNLFVEFSAVSITQFENATEKIGVHVVNWEICQHAPRIKSQPEALEMPEGTAEAYGFALYRTRLIQNDEYSVPTVQVDLVPAGAVLALDDAGRYLGIEMIWNKDPGYQMFRYSYTNTNRMLEKLIYFTLASFSEINQCGLHLLRTGDKSYQVA